ncbi:MAG: phenylalanine--tRNA ligase subunit alpha, partial [Candidatus Woesearchaeota archaeon]
MGFQEMTGPIMESCFYNCDALYMPQDHPARGIHDLYFLKEKADLKKDQKYLNNGRKVHEEGWKYKFDENKSKELLLRSHGTALSARTLAKAEIPGKYFALAKCYRPDVVDSTHLTEFYQLEGIVLDKNVNFRHLLGLLADFAKRIANADKIKFVPVAYFPFTEPSVTGYVWHKELKQWIEVLPAGIFRPEVTEPFGIKVPVLAWGIGLDRLFMIREGITDIRHLFSYNLHWLREAKI